jgi:hypothetical protein
MYGMTAELADVRVTELKQVGHVGREEWNTAHSALTKARNVRRRAGKGLLRRSPQSTSSIVS